MTENAAAPQAPQLPALHPLLQRLVQETRATVLPTEAFNAWAAEPGQALVVFAEEPERYKETLDLAVIVPELALARPGAFRVGLLTHAAARELAPRFGFARWPAFVMLRDGQYLGAVDGLRDWDVYLNELDRLLASQPTRAPGVGIRVAVAGASNEPHCH